VRLETERLRSQHQLSDNPHKSPGCGSFRHD
jgi:hypothetical protein